MDEARRFLRYIIPGLIFVLEVVLYLYLSQEVWLVPQMRKFLSTDNIGVVIGLLLASGGIGFLLSTIHHCLYWTQFYEWLRIVVDHRAMLKKVREIKLLELQLQDKQLQDKSELETRPLSRAGAWRVVCSIWHERRTSSKRIEGANPRVDSLTDIMHGAGTSFVGSILALLMWLYIHQRVSGHLPSLYSWILPIIFVLFHLSNFRQTVPYCQGVIEMVLWDELQAQKKCNEPVKTTISDWDIEKSNDEKRKRKVIGIICLISVLMLIVLLRITRTYVK